MWTVQAPHCAIPQPYFVPVSCSESRITHRSGVEGGSATLTAFPLRVNEIKDASFFYRQAAMRRVVVRKRSV
jgi:hypothetical protein